MSVRRISPRLQMILHSLATRVPKIVLCRAEDVSRVLHTSMTASVPEGAEILSRQETGHVTAPDIVPVTPENDISNDDPSCDVDNEPFTEETNRASVPEGAEIVSRQETGHLTAPDIVPVTSENDISKEDHSCDAGNELFTEETNVTEHRAECSYLCDVCKELFRSQKSLRVHERIHSTQRHNSCDVCQKVIKNLKFLQVHKCVHIEESCCSCNVCGISFVQLCHLRGQVPFHNGKRPFSCNVCNKSFAEHHNYKRHRQTIRCVGRSFSCRLCKKSFTPLSNLTRHKLIHSGKRSFVCGVCEKSFMQLPTLKRHELIHSVDRRYACDICKKSFTRRHILRILLKTHKQGASLFT